MDVVGAMNCFLGYQGWETGFQCELVCKKNVLVTISTEGEETLVPPSRSSITPQRIEKFPILFCHNVFPLWP